METAIHYLDAIVTLKMDGMFLLTHCCLTSFDLYCERHLFEQSQSVKIICGKITEVKRYINTDYINKTDLLVSQAILA